MPLEPELPTGPRFGNHFLVSMNDNETVYPIFNMVMGHVSESLMNENWREARAGLDIAAHIIQQFEDLFSDFEKQAVVRQYRRLMERLLPRPPVATLPDSAGAGSA